MSGQSPVPADAGLVVDFLNTIDVEEETDVLAEPRGWHVWTAERHLPPGPLPVAREVRAALRAHVGDRETGTETVATEGNLGVSLRVELTGEGPSLVAEDAVGAVLAAASRLALRGEWSRIKICPADDCRWAFYDQSRNRSRAWCSMRVCGNREKARVWRTRTHGG